MAARRPGSGVGGGGQGGVAVPTGAAATAVAATTKGAAAPAARRLRLLVYALLGIAVLKIMLDRAGGGPGIRVRQISSRQFAAPARSRGGALVGGAFSHICSPATHAQQVASCKVPSLGRVRPSSFSGIANLTTPPSSPCGAGKVLAQLDVYGAVAVASKQYLSYLAPARPYICTWSAEQDIYVSKQLQTNGQWDAPLMVLTANILTDRSQNRGLVIDVGANVGVFSLMAASLVSTVEDDSPLHNTHTCWLAR